MPNETEEFKRVWSVADYGNIAAIGVTAGEDTAGPSRLFLTDLPQGVSTIRGGDRIAPTKQNRAIAQEVLSDPRAFVKRNTPQEVLDQSLLDKSKTILANLFNTEDEKDLRIGPANLSGVESVWDGMLSAFNWGYDRINQGLSWAQSAAPGGIDTFSWDQAGQISAGQAAVTANAQFINQMREKFGLPGQAIGAVASAIGNPLGALGAQAGFAGGADFTKENFDILDPAQRKRAFEEQAVGKWATGLTDAVISIFADPLIFGGKALKIARLKYVDPAVTQVDNRMMRWKELNDAVPLAKEGRVDEMSPIARWVYEAITPNADGTRKTTRQLQMRAEIEDSHNAEGLADALATIPDNDMETAVVFMGAALGVEDAIVELGRRSVLTLDTLANAQRQKLLLDIQQNPERLTKVIADLDNDLDASYRVYEETKKALLDQKATQADVDRAFKIYSNNVATRQALDDGVLPDPLMMASPDEQLQAATAMVAELRAKEQWFARALDDANMGALQSANRAFSSDTAVGRFVGQRREARAQARYERKMTAGQGWRADDYFGASRFRRTVRLWTRLWDETPSYYVQFAGASNIDQGREIGAFLDSLEYLGQAKTVAVMDDTGKVIRTVDGITRKNELYSMYTQARSARQDVSYATIQLQREISKDIQNVYGLSKEVVDYVTDKMFREQQDLISTITRSEEGLFFDKGDKILSAAPFLRSQLAQGSYLLPYDQFEKIAKKISQGKVKDLPAMATAPNARLTMTKGQYVGQKIANADAIFQDLWRPAVLFRLGYPQRNVAEGLFRSVMFNSSLSPLMWAGKAGYTGTKNVRRAQRAAKRAEEARALVARPDMKRDEFDALVRDQKGIQERENALLGAVQRLRNEEELRDTANVVPLPTFVDDGQGLVSSDGLFRIQRVTTETEAAAAKPRRFTTIDRETGAQRFGDFTLTPVDGKKWRVVGPDVDMVVNSRNFAKNMAKERQAQIDATAVAAPTVKETYRVLQRSPEMVDYVAGKRMYNTIDEARAAVEKGVTQAFSKNGRITKADPGYSAIVQEGRKARAKIVKPFKDVDGKTYRSSVEAATELARLAKEKERVKAGIDAIGRRPVPNAVKHSKFQKWRESQIDEMEEQIASMNAFKETFFDTQAKLLGVKADEVFTRLDPIEQGNIKYLNDQVDDLSARMVAMERDDYFALAEYESQAAAKLRANSGSRVQNLPYGVVLEDAFGNPRNADLRFRNMSANNTMRATLAARLQLSESILYKLKVQNYVEVKPTDGAAYWEGMADMLRQYSVDVMGQMILKGKSDADIATWLLSEAGRSTRNAIDDAWAFRNIATPDTPPRIGDSMDRAMAFASQVRDGLNQITAGKTEIWDMLRSGPVSADQLKRVLDGNPALKPVVGHTDELSGAKNVMEIYRTLTQKAFEWIGTMPEDAFVRAPFYAARYAEAREAGLAELLRYYGAQDKIPVSAIYRVEENAARRALKDTKDFLYTIDRRTNLGKYGESILPFISATQNSITSIARLTRRDPALPGMMLALWNAPTKMGWEDEQGNIIIPLPKELIPDGVEDFFGLDGIENLSVSKGALNVIFPETGYAFAPRPSAPVQVLSSELMKKGFLGFSVEAPPMMVSFMGKNDADALWQQFKNWMYGEESGISSEFASLDKVLPPIANKMFQYIQKDGSSQYGYQYALQAKTQALKWWAGERDDYPQPDEIMQRTNGMFLLRMLGNAFAFTPPAYESAVQPLVDIQRAYDQKYGIEGPMKFSEQFGDVLLTIGNTASTLNVGGAMSSADTVRSIKANEDLIRKVSPNISDENLDILGILVNEDPKSSVYDTSAYRWLTTTNIPGTTRKWREVNSGAEAEAEVQRQAGWVEYMKFKGQLDALRQQRGLKSFRVKGAEQLNSYRREFIDNMKANPMYAAWVTDFESMGSSKTYDAVKLIDAALKDPEFMARRGDSRTWQMAALYIDGRQRLIDAVKASGSSLESKSNAGLAQEWDEFRNSLIDQDAGWAAIANRYLNGDDTPSELGTSFLDVNYG